MEILRTKDLTKTYKGKAALKDCNMTISKGDIYGFIGRNGAGKTTLIKLILGLSEPTSGSIELFGSTKLSSGRRNIGCVVEAPAFIPNMSARQNMYIQWILLNGKDKSIIDTALELVGLGDVGKKPVKKFSLGMKQRLGIAMTLMGEPDFLVLDEPVNGLDPEGIKEVRNLLIKLNKERGITILISSHLLPELSRLATRYGIINNGVLVEELQASELEEKAQSKLMIKVRDVEKAIEVLQKELDAKSFTKVDDFTIELLDHAEDSGLVNSILTNNGVIVDSISHEKVDLESYYLQKIGRI